jgi:hypothetical protein
LKIFKEIKECFFFKSFFYYQIWLLRNILQIGFSQHSVSNKTISLRFGSFINMFNPSVAATRNVWIVIVLRWQWREWVTVFSYLRFTWHNTKYFPPQTHAIHLGWFSSIRIFFINWRWCRVYAWPFRFCYHWGVEKFQFGHSRDDK